MCSLDAAALEILLVQALTTSDRLEYEQVGAHVATALDALRREIAARADARRSGSSLARTAGLKLPACP